MCKFNSLSTETRFLSDWHQSSTLDRWMFWADNNSNVKWYVCNANEPNFASVPYSPSLNTWYHLVGTYDGTNIELFVNGSSVGAAALTGDMNPGKGNIRIGKQSEAGGYFNGIIDETRISNIVRSAAYAKANDYNLRLNTLLSYGAIRGDTNTNTLFFTNNF